MRQIGAVIGSTMRRESKQQQAGAATDFENALRIIDATRSDVLDPHNRITLLSRLIDFYRGYVDALVAQLRRDAESARRALTAIGESHNLNGSKHVPPSTP